MDGKWGCVGYSSRQSSALCRWSIQGDQSQLSWNTSTSCITHSLDVRQKSSGVQQLQCGSIKSRHCQLCTAICVEHVSTSNHQHVVSSRYCVLNTVADTGNSAQLRLTVPIMHRHVLIHAPKAVSVCLSVVALPQVSCCLASAVAIPSRLLNWTQPGGWADCASPSWTVDVAPGHERSGLFRVSITIPATTLLGWLANNGGANYGLLIRCTAMTWHGALQAKL